MGAIRPESNRWVEVTPSRFPHEREGLELVRAALPDAEPYRAWSNVEIITDKGRSLEIDLMVLGPAGLYVVELKWWHGRLGGDRYTWVMRQGRRTRVNDNGELRRQVPEGQRTAAARWRPGGRGAAPAGAGEVELTGRRVLLDGGRAVLPWQETLRYAPVRAGYHGGASLAEMVIPQVVLSPDTREEPAGWVPAPPQAPAWWLGTLPALDGTAAPAPDLAARVLASAVYETQRGRARAGPVGTGDATVASVLRALVTNGGELPAAAVAAVAGIPEFRLPGLVSALQRLLNVDGEPVVGYARDGVTLTLDQDLLVEQFDLDAAGVSPARG